MTKIAVGSASDADKVNCTQALTVEFICVFLFVFAGLGSAMAADQLGAGSSLTGLFFVATANTFVVAVMISTGMRISDGHLNPAVTLGLLAGGHITMARSSLYLIDQTLASASACSLLSYLTTGLTTPHVNTLASGMDFIQGVIMEIILILSMIFIVYAAIVDPKKGFLNGPGPLLTGLVVGASIMAGGPFSGAYLNPARYFGPTLISGNWTDHWVYWAGPLISGGLAGLFTRISS
ncbi:aquaporin TIP4-1-like [Impatiens glandulifera]|uniref:aquaporin TIP4-1-like n=1 Tax=Impatiens glandulifera TaxID=253017 RepID=UPI001FB080E1|nr:aquaporin TIP4-1-like [Impatiens glandulifera]